MLDLGSRRGAAEKAALPLMIVAFLGIAGFLYWLNVTAVGTTTAVATAPEEDPFADAIPIAASSLETNALQFEGALLRVPDITVVSRVGDQAFWTQLPNEDNFFIKMGPELTGDSVPLTVSSGETASFRGGYAAHHDRQHAGCLGGPGGVREHPDGPPRGRIRGRVPGIGAFRTECSAGGGDRDRRGFSTGRRVPVTPLSRRPRRPFARPQETRGSASAVNGSGEQMAKVCELCGKGPATGNNVSHAHNKTRRRWLPNLQTVRVPGEGGGRRKARVCTRCISAGRVRKAPRLQPGAKA